MQSKCDICGSFDELNMCSSCGRLVCKSCFNQSKGMCLTCSQMAKNVEKNEKDYIE